MNKVILSGRFTRDPEQRIMSNQAEFSKFSLACQSSYVNKDEERDTEFINCVAFGRTAETINRYCKKGAMIVAQGRIKNNSYDAQDGTKRYTTDIIIDKIEFASKASGNASQKNSIDTTRSVPFSSVQQAPIDPYENFANEVQLSPDDLPF